MSCKNCEVAQQISGSYCYRWKSVNIEIRGCKKHIKEIIKFLNDNLPEIKEKPKVDKNEGKKQATLRNQKRNPERN